MGARAEWREYKSALEKSGIKMSDIADKVNFGPSLDDYEKLSDAYDKVSGKDQVKLEKAKAERAKAAKVAADNGRKYLKVLDFVEKNGNVTPPQKHVLEQVTMWLGRTILDIGKHAK